MNISFRPIELSDIPQIARWLRDEEVARWWWDIAEKTDEDLAKEYSDKAYDPRTERYVINVDGVGIGIIQTAVLANYPENAAEIGIPNAAGVDVYIGESEWRDRGVGTLAIRQFIDEVVFAIPGVETCTIDPEPENTRAIRAYEKSGFRHTRTYHSAETGYDVYLMRMERSST
jgi:aminoglycoside 6'-N-acetyltransferase